MSDDPAPRPRPRDLGLAPGVLRPGARNAITDVAGVQVGHATLVVGDDVRTGVTAVLPHAGDLFRERVPAGLFVGNGFGKLVGATQLAELGELETPVLLTNTLSVAPCAEALLAWTLDAPGNARVRSVNPVVGETNDGVLNDIRARRVTLTHAIAALEAARAAAPEDGAVGGNVGAGTGTVAFGWKGGIGTASRCLPAALGGWTVGALVQANYGGELRMDGLPVGKALGRYYLKDALDRGDADGSVVVLLATDAPLSDRNLTRLAARAMAGIARTGAAMSDGSGDYAIAFSTAAEVRRHAAPAAARSARPSRERRAGERRRLAALPGGDRGDRGSGVRRALPRAEHDGVRGADGRGAAGGGGAGDGRCAGSARHGCAGLMRARASAIDAGASIWAEAP